MLSPPYQQSPGASTTMKQFNSVCALITAACFTREKSFLICRDRWLFIFTCGRAWPARICWLNLTEGLLNLRTVLSNQTSEGGWADAMGQIYKWGDYWQNDKRVVSCSFARMGNRAEWVEESIDVEH